MSGWGDEDGDDDGWGHEDTSMPKGDDGWNDGWDEDAVPNTSHGDDDGWGDESVDYDKDPLPSPASEAGINAAEKATGIVLDQDADVGKVGKIDAVEAADTRSDDEDENNSYGDAWGDVEEDATPGWDDASEKIDKVQSAVIAPSPEEIEAAAAAIVNSASAWETGIVETSTSAEYVHPGPDDDVWGTQSDNTGWGGVVDADNDKINHDNGDKLNAVQKIQAVQRGRKGRAQANALRIEKTMAVEKIQAAQRGRKGRRQAASRRAEIQKQDDATRKIQAIQRGRVARRTLKEKKRTVEKMQPLEAEKHTSKPKISAVEAEKRALQNQRDAALRANERKLRQNEIQKEKDEKARQEKLRKEAESKAAATATAAKARARLEEERLRKEREASDCLPLPPLPLHAFLRENGIEPGSLGTHRDTPSPPPSHRRRISPSPRMQQRQHILSLEPSQIRKPGLSRESSFAMRPAEGRALVQQILHAEKEKVAGTDNVEDIAGNDDNNDESIAVSTGTVGDAVVHKAAAVVAERVFVSLKRQIIDELKQHLGDVLTENGQRVNVPSTETRFVAGHERIISLPPSHTRSQARSQARRPLQKSNTYRGKPQSFDEYSKRFGNGGTNTRRQRQRRQQSVQSGGRPLRGLSRSPSGSLRHSFLRKSERHHAISGGSRFYDPGERLQMRQAEARRRRIAGNAQQEYKWVVNNVERTLYEVSTD